MSRYCYNIFFVNGYTKKCIFYNFQIISHRQNRCICLLLYENFTFVSNSPNQISSLSMHQNIYSQHLVTMPWPVVVFFQDKFQHIICLCMLEQFNIRRITGILQSKNLALAKMHKNSQRALTLTLTKQFGALSISLLLV